MSVRRKGLNDGQRVQSNDADALQLTSSMRSPNRYPRTLVSRSAHAGATNAIIVNVIWL
jgi:hypothetical protein